MTPERINEIAETWERKCSAALESQGGFDCRDQAVEFFEGAIEEATAELRKELDAANQYRQIADSQYKEAFAAWDKERDQWRAMAEELAIFLKSWNNDEKLFATRSYNLSYNTMESLSKFNALKAKQTPKQI